MRQFLIKLMLFVTFIFGIGLFLWWKNGNRLLENAYLNEKLHFLDKHPEYNTVFIGSSKINNQINPAIIDSLNPGLKSYNLGANGSFNLENFETIDYLLEKKDTSLKNIVLELQNKTKFTKTNVSTPRSFTTLTPSNLAFTFNNQLENKDIRQVLYTAYSFVLNVFYFKREKKVLDSDYVKQFIYKNGFVPLDLDYSSGVKKRHQDLVKDPREIEKRIEAYESDKNDYKVNNAFVKRLQEVNAECERKNIRLVLLIPAPAEPDAKELLAYKKVRNIPILNYLDVKKHPEFYQLENRWDYGHLNEKGANLLSEKLAHNLKTILE